MIFWDPKREIFTLPFLDIPIVWYGVIFAFGFAVGYYIFVHILKRYLLNFPLLSPELIRDEDAILRILKKPKKKRAILLSEILLKEDPGLLRKVSLKKLLASFNGLIQREAVSSMELCQKTLQKKNLVSPKKAAIRLLIEKVFSPGFIKIKQLTTNITDRFTLYIVIATIVGARLGHLFFYEPPEHYLKNPWVIFQTWKGGLASHGAVVAILIAIFLFSKWVKKKTPFVTGMTVLDLVSVPTAFVAGCIRIGNFFNQEILGIPTKASWGVAFGHPFDGSMPGILRHPVQLYEAFFYFAVFGLLFFLVRKTKIALSKGKLIGLFLLLVFTFRFFIEFFKEEQSALLGNSLYTMGQLLSIPMIFLGFFFLIYEKLFVSRSKVPS